MEYLRFMMLNNLNLEIYLRAQKRPLLKPTTMQMDGTHIIIKFLYEPF